MGVVFLWPVVDDRVAVSKFFLVAECAPDFLVRHDEHRVRPLLSRFIVPLSHTAEVFAECCLPGFGRGRVVHEFFITRDRFARDGVDHWTANMFKMGRFGNDNGG
jgi:hypothetical protein